MPVLSKLAYRWGFPIVTANCHEVSHTWEPNCNKAIVVAIPGGFWFCLKTYTMFYVLTTLLNKRGKWKEIKYQKLIKDILQSSSFLTMNMITYLFYQCRIRHLLGFFIAPTFCGVSSFMACFTSILIEKESRRRPLALYLANLASETAYRQLANHGYVPRFNRGECVPLIAGIVLIMYLYSAGRLPQGLVKVLKTCAGIDTSATHLNVKNAPAELKKLVQELRTRFGRTEMCSHEHSCASTSIELFIRNFGLGLGIAGVLTLLKNIGNLFTRPTVALKNIISTHNLRLPFFFGLLPLLFHSSNCTLNRLGVGNKMFKNMLSGGIAGLSMLAFPNVTIAMYVLWKAIEVFYMDLYARGYLPYISYGDIILYTISTGYVLWMAALEPQAVRSGYREFLMGLTGGRLALFNRHLIDSFGYKSSLIYPSRFMPDPKHCTVNPYLYYPIR